MERLAQDRSHAADAHYVGIDQVCLVLSKAGQLGISAHAILRDARISYNVDDLHLGSIAQIPLADFIRLRESAVDSIREHAEQGIGRGMRRPEFELMCYAMLSGNTLGEAINWLCCFLEIGRGVDGKVELIVHDERAILSFHFGAVEKEWEPFFVANSFALFTRFFSWLVGEQLHPRFESPLANDAEGCLIASMLQTPFDAPSDQHTMIFDAGRLDRPVIRNRADLRLLLESFPADIVVKAAGYDDLPQRVAATYRTALLEGSPLPRLEEISRAIGMGSSTLRRQMEAQGHSIRLIKAQVLQDMAEHYLTSSDLSINEISWRLGYSGAKAFCRAFRTARNTTPTAFRSQARKTGT
jgi:AraC-like DNA-binding protein